MCGILGHIGNTDLSFFFAALDKIKHRGPDGLGIWEEEGIKLGHRRLAIIDLSEKAKQPMVFQNRFVLTFNGEIYNHLELKQELQKSGFIFQTNSDAEVLLNAFAKWGKECLLKLNGMWAFAIWDKQEKKLFLAKDRIGKKPLFYFQRNDEFIFGSEMKSLYPFIPEIKINYELVEKAKKNVFSYETTEDCLIHSIKRFPSGSYGFFQNGKLTIEKYWNPLENLITVPKQYDEQVVMFRELFLDACKLRMRSDVQIGTALSGGLDSSAVISSISFLANQKSGITNIPKWQNAYIACFPKTSLDETTHAKKVTDYLQIPLKNIFIDPLKEIENIFYDTYLVEELYLTSPLPFINLYKQIKQDGTSVTIDGHGADELFGGYDFDLNAALIDALPNPFLFKKYFDTIRSIYPFQNNRSYFKDVYNDLKFAVLNKYRKIIPTHLFNSFLYPKKDEFDYLNSELFQSTYETILPTLLRNYDRYSMSNGVEIRMPFLDHRILSFAFSIPSSSKLKNGFSKGIVRDALKDLMSREIAFRKDKIGFNSPFSEWLKGPLKNWMLDLISSNDFRQSSLIDSKNIEKLVVEAINKPNISFEDGERVWKGIMPFVWEKSLKYAK